MGYDLFPHKSGIGLIEPVALIGHNVCVKYANDNHYRRVIWFEPIAPFQFLDIGAIAAATTSARTQANNLQFWRNEFGQIRWYPIDTAQVRLYVPNADGRMNLRNLQVPVDPTIVTRDPCGHLTEFFVWEDRNPAFEAINYTAVALPQCRLIGQGFRFVTEELPTADISRIRSGALQCTYVVASGFSGKP
ncbi:MAG: hypothetical protein WC554_18840 [Clostridia bacterium]|jgi:hypothetical protein